MNFRFSFFLFYFGAFVKVALTSNPDKELDYGFRRSSEVCCLPFDLHEYLIFRSIDSSTTWKCK